MTFIKLDDIEETVKMLEEKGQIVIPKQARDIFGIKPGDTLLLLGDEERGIAIPNKGAFSGLFAAAFENKNGGEDR